MQWYYSADGAAVGPHSADDIEDLFATGEVAADTLVWRKGFAEWTPLGDTDEFARLADAGLPPPLPPAQRKATSYDADDDVLVADRLADDRRAGRHDDDTRVTTSPFTAATVAPVLAGPWTRYFARSIDMIIITLLLPTALYLGLRLASPQLSAKMLSPDAPAMGLLLLPLAFLANAIIITLFGNSLGKALFAIRAEPNDPDRHFGWGSNIVREFRVWFQGMALYIPLLSLFTMIPAFRRVLRGAPTTYDLGRVSVRAYSQSRLRRTLGMLFALLLHVGVAALGALDPVMRFSGGPPRSDTGPSAANAGLPPTMWTNPTTQLATTIPAGWQYEPATGADGADDMDMATYAAALAQGMGRTIPLGDWSMSNLPGVWMASGQLLSTGARATVYAAQTGNQFWRIVYVDQFSTTPGQIAEPELTVALFRSVGIGA